MRRGIAAGLVIATATSGLRACSGYGASVYFAKETKQPRATIGKGILWSLAIINAVLAIVIQVGRLIYSSAV